MTLYTVIAVVFRKTRTSVPPAGLGCIAYDHRGHTHGIPLNLTQRNGKLPSDCRPHGACAFWFSFMQWLSKPPTLDLMAHCAKRISPCWQQTIEISGSDTHMWRSAESAEKMSKREMKCPPSRPWTWLNQQWKSMSWKELAGKINEGIMHWPMNFVPFCILVWCSNLNIQVYLFQIILAFPFIFKFSVTSSTHATTHQALCTI